MIENASCGFSIKSSGNIIKESAGFCCDKNFGVKSAVGQEFIFDTKLEELSLGKNNSQLLNNSELKSEYYK